MRVGAAEVNKLLAAHSFNPSKAKGQNFLIDPNIPEKLVRLSGIGKSSGVLEAGPGMGALTVQLCRASGHVTAVELDTRLMPILREVLKEHSNVTLVQGNILKVDIKKLVDETMGETDRHVCANLPYSITTPAISAFIKAEVFDTITVMIQKEVAERIVAKPGSPEYGAFTIYVNYHSSVEKLFDVPPECFIPQPKVTSTVIKMSMRKERSLSPDSEKLLFRLVRAAFGQRRKTLVNALYAEFGETLSKEYISQAIVSCGFDSRVRGEALSVEDFIIIASFFQYVTICK